MLNKRVILSVVNQILSIRIISKQTRCSLNLWPNFEQPPKINCVVTFTFAVKVRFAMPCKFPIQIVELLFLKKIRLYQTNVFFRKNCLHCWIFKVYIFFFGILFIWSILSNKRENIKSSTILTARIWIAIQLSKFAQPC